SDSVRSNKHDELGLMRCKRVSCSICGWAMKVKYPRSAYGRMKVPHPPEYYCRRKEGGVEIVNNHTISISLRILDREAWEYAKEFLLNPQLVRDHIATLRNQVTFESNSQVIEQQITVLQKKISNLIALAADAEDADTIDDLKGQLRKLEDEKRKLMDYLDNEERQEEENAKINRAIDEFEEWARKVAPRLTDPELENEVPYIERRMAILAIGVKAIVYPGENKKRIALRIAPPKIMELMPLIS
ncbi:MAG TPA: hypothetical protein VEI53_06140, partial [Ktedonobacteraceae bacterium]|nr:hypothetical protein [Ktedonobacteraceae bacterium]